MCLFLKQTLHYNVYYIKYLLHANVINLPLQPTQQALYMGYSLFMSIKMMILLSEEKWTCTMWHVLFHIYRH